MTRRRRFHPAVAIVPLALVIGGAALPAGAVDVVEASITGGELVSKVVVQVPEEREQVREVIVEDKGRKKVVKEVVVVVVTVPTLVEQATSLDSVWATDAAGNEIPREKLVKLLRKPTLVVTGEIPVEQRAIFREGTLFLEVATSAEGAGDEVPAPAAPAP